MSTNKARSRCSPSRRTAGRPRRNEALRDARQSLRGIASIYAKELEAKVEGDRIATYRLNARVPFEVEGA